MSAAPPWTIKTLIAWTTKYFSEKGIESPRLEAELLLAHTLKCKRIDLIVRYDEIPGDAARAAYRDVVKRRSEHWPTAYLTGDREFFLLPFAVSPAVLIPRPDTETLLLAALEELKLKPAARVLDLGTGSGCLAVSIAHKYPQATVVAVDLSPDALAVATANSVRHDVTAQIDFRLGDLFAAARGETFDLIISNPPYITSSEMLTLQEEVRDHEPRLALDGGPDGLAFYRRIARDAPTHLTLGGAVMVEIGATQSESVRNLFAETLTVGRTIKDGAGIARVIESRK